MISWPPQLAQLLLFLGAVFCATFLRGDARLMFGVMAAAPVSLLLSLIPRRFFSPLFRQLVQLGMGAGALYWAHTRLNQAPIDLILVEVSCILGVALLIGRNAHEYAMLYFISIGFLGYGGLMPGRAYFLHVFTASAFLLLAILYSSRMAIMQPPRGDGDRDRDAAVRPRRPLALVRHSLGYRVLHAVAALLVLLVMLRYLPQTRKLKIKGLIPVSFNTENEILFPELWKNWHQPASQLVGGTAENNAKDDGKGGQRSAAKQHAFDSSTILNMPNQPTFDSRNGNGFAFGTGNQLVFRVISPAKLYWVVQMYDDYDGDTWRVTNAMHSGKTGPDQFIPVHEVEVPQHFSMDNPSSNKLPYAFRFRQVTFRSRDSNSFAPGLVRSNRSDVFSITLRADKMSPPPWTYRVQSFVPNPELKKPLRAWREPLRNNGWNYRRLPEARISDRLRDLARQLTEDAATPYDKALRIRDYLRSTCTYTLTPPPVPPNREVVDFFLFDSQEGYCQHFAQAFTVLARLAGLHSRLVTGYAPGNYNLLTNTFEVYQYHAHAWTHIFIEPYGWLTFDGVAPSNLNLQNTPALLTELMDPFGKEWNARPPELTYIPPPPPEQSMAKSEKTADPANSFAGKVYAKAAKDNKTDEPNNAELGKAAVQLASATLVEKATALWRKVSAAFVSLLNGASNAAMLLAYSACRMDWLDLVVCAFAAVTALAAYAKRRWFAVRLSFLVCLYRCRRRWFRMQRGGLAPHDLIIICHGVATDCLRLAGFSRPPSCDLVEWADLIARDAPELVDDYRPIALAASRLQFSAQPPSPELASSIISATEHLCRQLSPYLTQAFANGLPTT